MATASALAPLFVFFLLVNTAPAARTVTDAAQDLCSKTQFPKICVAKLTPTVESSATPRRAAELFANIVSDEASAMAAFVDTKLSSTKDDDAMFRCFDGCSDDVEETVAHIRGVTREPTDAKFLELKSWLSATLGGGSACEDACKDAPESGNKDDVIKYSVDIEKMLRVTLDLITEASGSMSADIALPPSDASPPSYGAATAYGGSSGTPAEGLGPATVSIYPEAPTPSYGAVFGGSPSQASAPAAIAVLPEGDAADAAPAPSYGAAYGGSPAEAPGPATTTLSPEGDAAPAPSDGSSKAADAPAPSYGSSKAADVPAPSYGSSKDADAPAPDDASNAYSPA